MIRQEKYLEYKVVEAESIDELNEEVNAMIADGWEPLSGVSVSLSEGEHYQFYAAAQAMVRRSEQK